MHCDNGSGGGGGGGNVSHIGIDINCNDDRSHKVYNMYTIIGVYAFKYVEIWKKHSHIERRTIYAFYYRHTHYNALLTILNN